MYNESLKLRFIKSYTSSEHTEHICKSIFNELEPYEQKWNADICTKSNEEVQPAINSIMGMRMRSVWTKVTTIRAYCSWCLRENIPGACDGILKANLDSLDIIKIRMVASPEHLQECLNKIFAPENELTVDNIYRCYYWLAFMGVDREDIFDIRCRDIDLKLATLHYDNRDIYIYPEAIPAMENGVTLKDFVYKHPLYSNIVYKERAPGETLIRGLTSDTDPQKMMSRLSGYTLKARRNGKKIPQFSYNRIYLSGLFYRAYVLENNGHTVDFMEAAKKYMAGKEYNLSSGRNTRESRQRRIANDYREDFERWKLAFHDESCI